MIAHALAGRLVFESALFVVLDVSDLLTRHPTKRYPRRDPAKITRVTYHETGGRFRSMPDGLNSTAAWFTREPPHGLGWPGFGYGWYVPYDPPLYPAYDLGPTVGASPWLSPWHTRYVVYQTQPLDVRSYHTLGYNDTGAAVVFQGAFSPYYPRWLDRPMQPSLVQRQIAIPLWSEYLQPLLRLNNNQLHAHNETSTKSCPGSLLTNIVNRVAAA